MGIDSKGRVFFLGTDGAQWPLFPSQTMRTSDNGRTWDDVTPKVPQDHLTTEDPYLYVDEDTDTVFTSDFMLPCTAVSRSDDAGDTWASSVTACDLMDHQTIFAGKPVNSETTGYSRVVYYCAADYVTGLSTSCLKSIDGGQVFLRTGEQPFPGVSDSEVAAQCGGVPAMALRVRTARSISRRGCAADLPSPSVATRARPGNVLKSPT